MIEKYIKVFLILSILGSQLQLWAQPSNNVCETAIPLTDVTNWCSDFGAFTNMGATPSGYGPATCFAGVINDVWFSFVAEATDITIIINGASGQGAGGSMTNPQAALYVGTCGGVINQLECQAGNLSNIIELYQGGLTIGETYFIRVKNITQLGGTFQVCLNNYFSPIEATSDCPTASVLCDKSPFQIQSVVGAGTDITELDDALCFSNGSTVNNETNSTWFTWICDQAGPLTFTLNPNNPSDDLDFVIYELPNGIGNCQGKTVVRCMASGDFNFPSPCMGPTGLAFGETDISEPAGCANPNQSNFLAPLDMEAGKAYALVVNNFTSTGNGFSIEFGGSGTFLGPQPDFNTFPPKTTYCIAEEINFLDASAFSLGSITNQTWYFGLDAVPATATGQGFHSVSYQTAGLKTIALVVETNLGCQVTEIKTILIEPCCDDFNAMNVSSLLTENDCFGDEEGMIDLTATSITTVSFDWSNGSIMPDLTNLANGVYSVTLTNEATCDTILSFEITSPPPIEAIPQITMPTCNGGQDGAVTLITTGGVPPYLYNWQNGQGFVANSTLSNLPVGLINVVIRDANDCEITLPVDVRELELQLDPTIEAYIEPSCFGASDGSIFIAITNGLAPYEYNFNGAGFQNQNSVSGLAAGIYTVEVRDANGCLGFYTFDIGQPEELSVSLDATNVSCFGLNDGSITANVAGGTPDFQYQWSNQSTNSSISNLGPGDYTVTVTDSRGCTALASVTIVQPPELFIFEEDIMDVRCFGESNGEITVSGGGGNPGYQFSLEGGPYQDASFFAGLKAGSYQLTVIDMLGCTAEIILDVNQPPPLLVDAGPDVTIELGFSTTITALVQPSLNGVDLSWTPNEFIDCAVCPTINANPVNTTTYTVTVTDQAGCTASDQMTVVVLKIRRIFIPNSFSPDFNGINDNFTIYGGIGAESIVELRIYNRWGGLIFEGFDLPLGSEPDGWDGTFKGRVLDSEVFAYYALIRFIDEEIILYKGDIQLIR